MRPINPPEVEDAVKSMPSIKAPGPDGFTIDFFQHCWVTIKEEVCLLVENSRKVGRILPALNATFLSLIPKEANVVSANNFRPISLCNVIYKIITKIIATRLKPLLPSFISEERIGYVEGRQILDDIIHAHEIIHSLKLTKFPGMILKLDFSKAFDKLNWN